MHLLCNFENILLDNSESFYLCEVVSDIIKESQVVKSIVGEHKPGKTNEDVAAIWFHDKEMKSIPRGMTKIFPNLRLLRITRCGLISIARKDLQGLEDLEILEVDDNQLSSLPLHLFTGMTKLRKISFNNNKLETLSGKLLEPLDGTVVEVVSFLQNKEVNACYSKKFKNGGNCVGTLNELKKVIQAKPEVVENFAEPMEINEERAWHPSQFLDFTIIGGLPEEEKEFKVHSFVLRTQSSSFDPAQNPTINDNTMTINDFSADVIDAMLHFIYSGQIKDSSMVKQLFSFGERYNIPLLLNRTANMIVDNMVNESNALEVLELGIIHNSDLIKKAAFIAIQKMLPNIHESMINKPERLKLVVEKYRKIQELQAEIDQEMSAQD
jgi:Leucine-rich repeat (LRR) protein